MTNEPSAGPYQIAQLYVEDIITHAWRLVRYNIENVALKKTVDQREAAGDDAPAEMLTPSKKKGVLALNSKDFRCGVRKKRMRGESPRGNVCGFGNGDRANFDSVLTTVYFSMCSTLYSGLCAAVSKFAELIAVQPFEDSFVLEV